MASKGGSAPAYPMRMMRMQREQLPWEPTGAYMLRPESPDCG